MEMSGQLHALAVLSPEKELRYPLHRRLCGPKRGSGCCGEEKNLSLPRIEPRPYSPLAAAIPKELSRLLPTEIVGLLPDTRACSALSAHYVYVTTNSRSIITILLYRKLTTYISDL
jgi:hypothetical protein